MKKHYHVFMGLSGYMPDVAASFTAKRDAERFAADLAKQVREQNALVEPEYREPVSGSAKSGWYKVGECNYIEIVEHDGPIGEEEMDV